MLKGLSPLSPTLEMRGARYAARVGFLLGDEIDDGMYDVAMDDDFLTTPRLVSCRFEFVIMLIILYPYELEDFDSIAKNTIENTNNNINTLTIFRSIFEVTSINYDRVC